MEAAVTVRDMGALLVTKSPPRPPAASTCRGPRRTARSGTEHAWWSWLGWGGGVLTSSRPRRRHSCHTTPPNVKMQLLVRPYLLPGVRWYPTPSMHHTSSMHHTTSCSSCSRALVGRRRGKVTRRSYPCVPPQPPDPVTGAEPRLCERCWRRARYHDPQDTYRKQVRDKQRRWHEKRTRAARGTGARGNGKVAKGGSRKTARRSTSTRVVAPAVVPTARPPVPQSTAPLAGRKVSSAQRLLAGR